MKGRIAIRGARRPLLAALLLVALLGRALIPPGYMPDPHGLILCPGYAPGIHTMTHDMSGMDMSGMDMTAAGSAHSDGDAGHGDPAPDDRQPQICPFAAAATTMVASNAPVALIPSYLVTTDLILPASPVIPRGTIVPTRLPRGPPVYS